jgi:hypothetical protein
VSDPTSALIDHIAIEVRRRAAIHARVVHREDRVDVCFVFEDREELAFAVEGPLAPRFAVELELMQKLGRDRRVVREAFGRFRIEPEQD